VYLTVLPFVEQTLCHGVVVGLFLLPFAFRRAKERQIGQLKKSFIVYPYDIADFLGEVLLAAVWTSSFYSSSK
jgi:hypothetical protein